MSSSTACAIQLIPNVAMACFHNLVSCALIAFCTPVDVDRLVTLDVRSITAALCLTSMLSVHINLKHDYHKNNSRDPGVFEVGVQLWRKIGRLAE